MKDVGIVIDAVRLAIATAEALSGALGKAKKDLDIGTEQLKDVLAEIEKQQTAMHEQLARDRKEARDAFDKKFDHGGGDEPDEPDEPDAPAKSDDRKDSGP